MAWAAIDPDGPMLAIGSSKAEQHLNQQIPGCNLSRSDGIWRAPLTWQAWVAFRTVWSVQPVDIHPALAAWGEQQWAVVQERYRLRSQPDADETVRNAIQDIEGERGLHLFPAQRGGVQWLVQQQRTVLEDPMGNGKMIQAIRALQLAAFTGQVPCPALVIAPGAALFAWKDKLGEWAPELTARVVTGTALRRRQALADQEPADVYAIAWENLRLHTRLAAYPGQRFVRCEEHGGTADTAAKCEVHEKELNLLDWGTVIADEAHRMQDARSKQTRAAWHMMHGARYAWALTGTPVNDNIGQLWPIMHGIHPLGFPARSRWLDLYAVKEHGWQTKGEVILGIRPDTEAAFHLSVQPLMRRIPQAIARPGMPARLEPVFRYPPMTPKQATAYKQLRKQALAELDGVEIVPKGTLAVFGRMCQLASAMIEVADGEDKDGFTREVVSMTLPSSKADDLLDYLKDHEGSLVVAANSPALIGLAERKLNAAKITTCKIIGGMSAEEKDQAAKWFQDGTCRVAFINQAGAEAITLTRSATVFFMQPEPGFRAREQKIGRVDRIGQDRPVQVVNSITPGTVEQQLYELGTQREERATQVTRDADLMRWIIAPGQPAAEDRQEVLDLE